MAATRKDLDAETMLAIVLPVALVPVPRLKGLDPVARPAPVLPVSFVHISRVDLDPVTMWLKLPLIPTDEFTFVPSGQFQVLKLMERCFLAARFKLRGRSLLKTTL